MEHKDKYRDIRPLLDEEVEAAVQSLIAERSIQWRIERLNLPVSYQQLVDTLKTCHTVQEFKERISYQLVMFVAGKTCFSLTASGRSKLEPHKAYTFVSNHRDIVLDSAFLNVLLHDRGLLLPRVAIGDNLLVYPWVETLVKLNDSFLVKRNLKGREVLLAAQQLSAYMHENIQTEHSQWIAQREGRAKDADDKTQLALLKMLAMSGKRHEPLYERVLALNIIPTSLSYEYDPCDYLKAREMYLKSLPIGYQKTPEDDALSMATGVQGWKGRVHLSIGTPLRQLVDEQKLISLSSNEQLEYLATQIDSEIYRGYRLYPNNYIALDLLEDKNTYSEMYSYKELREFEDYLASQIDRIELPENCPKDREQLFRLLLEQYANLLKNYIKTQ